LVLSLDTTNPLKLLRSNLSILQQTDKAINIAGCLVLEQSRGIEKEEEKFLIIDITDTTTTGLCGIS
jgi:hypothetical protein